MTEAHITEYHGDTYETPPLIDRDDGKENDTSENPQHQA